MGWTGKWDPSPFGYLLLHSGYLYCYQLAELAARSRRRPVRHRTDIQTACQCDHQWYQYQHCQPINLNFLRLSPVGSIYQLGLVPQPRVHSHMRAYRHAYATMGLQVPPDGSTGTCTPCERTYLRVFLCRAHGVSAFMRLLRCYPSSIFRDAVLCWACRLCLSRQSHRSLHHPRNRGVLLPLICHSHPDALFFHDCPYQTPPTSLIWYGAHIFLLLLSYAALHCAKGLHKLGNIKGAVTDKTVKSLQRWHESKARRAYFLSLRTRPNAPQWIYTERRSPGRSACSMRTANWRYLFLGYLA